ncbi:MAG: molecular chaperone HtpG [Rickettsiales bacterium]|nr:molecular chaperone HtpG [Rickettsiales bacterium]
MAQAKKTQRKFKAEVSRLLQLVVNSLYSNKEIFLRELVSNSSDAIDRLKLAALTDDSLLDEDEELAIKISCDAEARTITIADNGIGMSRDELIENLGTVAHSGTLAFLQQAEQSDARLIGQFGVGFYSSFIVADSVEVISCAAGSDGEAWSWTSDATESFTVAPAERDGRGTTLVLHLREDQDEFLDTWRLRSLINRYSDYVSHPILLPVTAPDGEEQEDKLEQVNEGNALWQRPASELDEEQYAQFYKHLCHDWNEPLGHNHFKIEGKQLFTGLLFLPAKPPHDLFMREHRRGVRLFVNRVFIMDDCEELVPVWLRFMRGVIDSDDLPLNVSRELLQDSAITRVIRKQVIKKSLDLFHQLAKDKPEEYLKAWEHFGAVLKEGLHMSPEHSARLAGLLRYSSSADQGLSSLDDYVDRMAEGQKDIYYVLGESEAAVSSSPHLESLKAKGYEVLYMCDAIDEWAVQGLGDFDGKKFVSVQDADLELEESEAEKAARGEHEEALTPLFERMKAVLEEQISELRLSSRLTDSPCCLVVPAGGHHAYLERLLRAQDDSIPRSKRILEVNPTHPLVLNLKKLHELAPESDQVTAWIEMLYDQVLLSEGSPLEDPSRLARRVTQLMEEASSTALATLAD